MDLEDKIKDNLRKAGLKPNKRLGQNFMVDQEDLYFIAEALEISSGEKVLEVGPGTGVLTEKLLEKGARVTAVEKDEKMSRLLKNKFGKKIELLTGSVLDLGDEDLPKNYKLVGNIPYYITGAVIKKFLTQKKKPKTMVVTLQKEVGERIIARPPRANFLSGMVGVYGKAKILREINSDHFWPEPKVSSVVLKIDVDQQVKEEEELVQFLKLGFSQPRKTLLNNLSTKSSVDKLEAKIILEKLGFGEKTRASELSLEDWKMLKKELRV